MNQAYKKAGVDIHKADRFVGKITQLIGNLPRNRKISKSLGGYASLYEASPGHYICATTDGVGTKLKLAFSLNRHDTVGIDLVAMSVNDLICVGAKPVFFLDYFATGKLSLKTSTAVLRGIVEGCRQSRCALVGGETAEMPGFYAQGEYDLAGFAVGEVRKKDLLDGSRVKQGDLLFGLPSSGPHSNGFSLIRKLFNVESKRDKNWIRKCFVPTKIYVDDIEGIKSKLPAGAIKGLAHITGSGFLNIPRINEAFSYDISWPNAFTTPAVFLEMQKRGSLTAEELFQTFNMGFGMVMAVDEKHAGKLKKSVGVHYLGKITKRKAHTVVSIDGFSKKKLELRY